jgi:methyl-accepting chemotaxis protein
LDQATQQNAALVEETAAASSSLSDQAQRLSDEISFFQLR